VRAVCKDSHMGEGYTWVRSPHVKGSCQRRPHKRSLRGEKVTICQGCVKCWPLKSRMFHVKDAPEECKSGCVKAELDARERKGTC
jgi:hypothetical protein